MRIAEVFCSVQGEGLLLGTPSVFVRIGNVTRHWCENPSGCWRPSFPEPPMGTVLAEVRRHWTDHVVITGEEPMSEADIVELSEALRGIQEHVTIETHGANVAPVACDLMSITVGREHPDIDVLRRLMEGYAYQLKFAVSKPEEMEAINELVRETEADRNRVVLMPETGSAAKMRERGQWIVEACKCHGYHYSPRLHVDLSAGKTRPRRGE